MLIRVPCDCGKTYIVGVDEAGTTMICPECSRQLVVPRPASCAPGPGSPKREGRFWQDLGNPQPDPTSLAEQEYQRSVQPTERVRRAAARRPARVRLWGIVWLTAGILVIPPARWLAAQLHLPNIPWGRRAPGYVGLLALIILYKGWVEVVTGVHWVELFKLSNDPRLGWREFGTWLFMVASIFLVTAAWVGISMVLVRFLGMPDR